MKQKLYYLSTLDSVTSNIGSGEIEFPQDLKDLIDAGWRIIQVSAYGYQGQRNIHENCMLLLQRETEN